MIKESDIAWAAGIIDSEGCIAIVRLSNSINLRLTVMMTHEETIVHFRKIFCHGYLSKINAAKKNWKSLYRFVANSNAAFEVLKLVEKYLITKKEQAKLGIEFGTKCLNAIYNKWNRIPEENQILREIIFDEMKILNRVGPQAKLKPNISIRNDYIKDNIYCYLAGLIDGDGCLSIGCNAKGIMNIKLAISMTHQETIYFVKGIFKIGSIYLKSLKNKNSRDQWAYMVSGKKAAQLVKLIKPYLVTKKKQADLILEFNDRCTSEFYKEVPIDILNLRTEIRNKVMALNKRGIN